MDGSVQVIGPNAHGRLRKADAESEQLVWPGNAPDARITLTRVTLAPGGEQARHNHPEAEQTWVVERGRATLLLEGGEREVGPGDVVRTPPGRTHGLSNRGGEPFVYLTITTPPQDFRAFYDGPPSLDQRAPTG